MKGGGNLKIGLKLLVIVNLAASNAYQQILSLVKQFSNILKEVSLYYKITNRQS